MAADDEVEKASTALSPLEQEDPQEQEQTEGPARRSARELAKDVLKKSSPNLDLAPRDDNTPSAVQIREAGDLHDLFNLLALPVVLVFLFLNLDFAEGDIERFWYEGDWFWAFVAVTLTYFAIDLAWVVIVPYCVKSPMTIWIHHCLTMVYILVPIIHADARWFMCACMSVEINTWFLIMRRYGNRARLEPCGEGVPGIVSFRLLLVKYCFHITWIFERLILYPVLLVLITIEYIDLIWWEGWFNIMLITPILQTAFVWLNFKWSYDLYCPAQKQAGPSRGL